MTSPDSLSTRKVSRDAAQIAGASVLEIGYDGRIIDASIEGLTIGITYMYKDGKFEFGCGAGWLGWSVSIDFVELFKLLFGGE